MLRHPIKSFRGIVFYVSTLALVLSLCSLTYIPIVQKVMMHAAVRMFDAE